MPRPTPDEIRASVARMLALDLDLPLILIISGLSEQTVCSIRKRWEEGIYRAHQPIGVGRPQTLDIGDVWSLCDRLAQDPDVFLDELQRELSDAAGVDVHVSTVWRALQRLGVTRKVLDKRAMEICDEERAEFQQAIRAFRPSQVVAVGENAINRRMTYQNRGYALAGDRAVKRAFFVRGKRYSILPALCIAGILTALIIEGAYDTALFLEFLELCLASMNPFPADNSVLVMGNCAIHISHRVQEMCNERGVILVYLPPYSHDLSPIEFAFAKIKTGIQRDGDDARMAFNAVGIEPGEINVDVEVMLHRHVYSVTAEDAKGWFNHCGYIEDIL
ncbi:unnamed protein product [Rhizoctonia solani]|uniref:Tc1-like transposase DDE domain-containing protein n=1 Tax=Rhizoctonia solani TaxID=456999 RepID=A0A8H3DLP1_9AGAM|nr:unnamed protein product [Rhizoctonia solani]